MSRSTVISLERYCLDKPRVPGIKVLKPFLQTFAKIELEKDLHH